MGARTHRGAVVVIGGPERDRLALLVHEVRSPVAALAAIRETLGGSSAETEGRSELVRLVLGACTAIERIVSDASVSSLEREPVDVTRLLHDTAVAARLRGASVRVVVPSDALEIRADPVRIRQALENLLANALAHTTGGDVVLEARAEGGEAILSVTDSGAGIPEAEHSRIFEPGVRLGSTYAGSGLGLAVVKSIAEAHGGRVTIRSAPGEGATVALALPLSGD
ncbi:MAG TPA: HAMP domain-containing sensor histidine kinase [Gaiellaceae bacterium]|nr:HAMP domain-containing sensor histidine kinase [Gaiellaceae bacterium]